MKTGAVIFDIYKTLLDVMPPPGDAETGWRTLCISKLGVAEGPTLAQFDTVTSQITATENLNSKARGISCPEIYWPEVARRGWPLLAGISPSGLDDFLYEHARLQRSVSLMKGAAAVLRALSGRKKLLGLASNSQPYTLRELDQALRAEGLDMGLFQQRLTFLSFQHGFSKPDPHVFQILRARLAHSGIFPFEVLMVGDREDNDVRPAQAAGFRTWHLNDSCPPYGGDWKQLGEHLAVV